MLLASKNEAGSSMIEVLVTLLVFTVGMLGLAALQLNALQGSSDSAQRSQTTWLLQDIAERIRANPEGTAAAYEAAPDCTALPAKRCADFYNPATSAKVAAAQCSASEMAAFDHWESRCSYSAIATYNTINARFTSRDFISTPTGGASVSIANNGNVLTLQGFWLGKADNAKGTADQNSQTTAMRIQR
ncbi:type IV pilus modification protein PilV [Pseudomonas anguilliseptica]|uniref:type IV pilus modification protein PilV n=1 Tax=Pseudomonas anguilliseptica TaxID=53406 RepID=UPI0022B01E2D|nr:type IV pilus modification protein PilV [Pseudomonas anguilliseptica]MCZ4321090.1 type IV pilus modification protein PilV [Pseudomonas anguilliseptica]